MSISSKHILFDLDGTLVNSSEGIINAFTYSFSKMNTEVPDKTLLSTFIGPPLETSFKAFFPDQEKLDQAIYHFRTFYKKTGVGQTHLYPNIKDLLQQLKVLNLSLYVTTSKFEPMATRMLEELDIDTYFDNIYGATASRFHKSDVIKDCLLDNNIAISDAVIIGDTKFDIIGAKEVGIKSIGATWGFGTAEELLVSKADAIINYPFDLVNLLKEK